jgi:hypothetical protein
VQTAAGVVEVRGRLAPPPAKLYDFVKEENGPIRQNLDLTRFRAETGLPLLPYSLQQAGPPSEGLLRQWPAGRQRRGEELRLRFPVVGPRRAHRAPSMSGSNSSPPAARSAMFDQPLGPDGALAAAAQEAALPMRSVPAPAAGRCCWWRWSAPPRDRLVPRLLRGPARVAPQLRRADRAAASRCRRSPAPTRPASASACPPCRASGCW